MSDLVILAAVAPAVTALAYSRKPSPPWSDGLTPNSMLSGLSPRLAHHARAEVRLPLSASSNERKRGHQTRTDTSMTAKDDASTNIAGTKIAASIAHTTPVAASNLLRSKRNYMPRQHLMSDLVGVQSTLRVSGITKSSTTLTASEGVGVDQ